MVRRLVIAVDCDDVLIETSVFLVEEYNKKFGTNVTLEHAYHEDNPEWGVDDRSLVWERLSALQHTDDYADIEPIEEAIEAVRLLAMEHELHLITARDKSVARVTQAMLDTHLDGCFVTVEHVGRDRSKGEVCKQINADLLIDDNIKNLVSALDHGLSLGGALHFGQYPWNRLDKEYEGVVGCRDWRAVMQEVQRIAA